MKRPIRLAVVAASAVAFAGASIARPAPTPEECVRAFVAAFNARDVDGMLALATDGVEWASVDGAKVTIETAGKEALRTSMTSYFASCPSCRSALEWVAVTGARVAAFERASWTAKDGAAKSQASLSVYELVDGKIARVYYFPAER